jgi:hypothetical protein
VSSIEKLGPVRVGEEFLNGGEVGGEGFLGGGYGCPKGDMLER